MSMMWQIRITVLQAKTQMQTKIRHSNTLALTDMVLVRTAQLHYFPTSEFPLFSCLFISIYSCRVTLVVVVPHWFYVHHIGCICTALVAPHNGWSFFPFLLPVREKFITSEDGKSIIDQDLVKSAPLIKSPGYNLLNDDPGVYSDGEAGTLMDFVLTGSGQMRS